MSDMSHYYSPSAPLSASLVAAYQQAIDVLVKRLRSGTAAEILSASRAALVAEAALLLDSGGALERQIAASIHEDIAQVDRDLAELTRPRTNEHSRPSWNLP